jgi:hypothetical protein
MHSGAQFSKSLEEVVIALKKVEHEGDLSPQGIEIARKAQQLVQTAEDVVDDELGGEFSQILDSMTLLSQKITAMEVRIHDKESIISNNLRKLIQAIITSESLRKILKRLHSLILRALSSQKKSKYDSKSADMLNILNPILIPKNTPNTSNDFCMLIKGRKVEFLTNPLNEKQLKIISNELKELFIEISRDPPVKNAIGNLIKYLKNLMRPASIIKRDQEILEIQKHLEQMITGILEKLAGGYKISNLEALVDLFTKEVKENRSIIDDWKKTLEFLKSSIETPSFIESKSWESSMIAIITKLRAHMYSKRLVLFRIMQELDQIISNLRVNEFISKLSRSVKNFLRALVHGTEGAHKYSSFQCDDLKKILVPILQSHFSRIPLPIIHETVDSTEIWISNLSVMPVELIPAQVSISEDKRSSELVVSISGLSLRLCDIHLRYARLSFPRISDEGVFSLRFTASVCLRYRVPGLDLLSGECVVGGVCMYDLGFAAHGWLMVVLRPLLERRLSRQLSFGTTAQQ